jgi:hypothetical protein
VSVETHSELSARSLRNLRRKQRVRTIRALQSVDHIEAQPVSEWSVIHLARALVRLELARDKRHLPSRKFEKEVRQLHKELAKR